MKICGIVCCVWAIFDCCIPAFGADVTMAFGERIPPYSFPESNQGIEVEIIGEALAFSGHRLMPRYYPLARVPLEYKTGKVDAAMTDLGEDLTKVGGFYGNPAVFYDNVFISLKERKLVVNKPEDLDGKTVISFVGAAIRYPEWLAKVKKEGRYFEQNDQQLQVLTLNKGHYDLALSDRNIFQYFTLKLQREKGFVPKAVDMHSFVEINSMDYRPIFRDAKIRNDFNVGLAHLKSSGRFEKIYDKYLKNDQ